MARPLDGDGSFFLTSQRHTCNAVGTFNNKQGVPLAAVTSKAVRKQRKQAVEKAFKKGFAPPGLASPGNSAIYEAARSLSADPHTMHSWYKKEAANKFREEENFLPDESLYAPADLPEPKETGNAPAEPVDPVRERKYKDALAGLNKRLVDAERRANLAEDIRSSVLGLTEAPLVAKHRQTKDKGPSPDEDRTVILHLSDVHYGENVSLEEMDGVNSYNVEIAQARLGRFFSKATELMTDHWSGKPPAEVVLVLGGDLISGGIHDELLQTNDVSVPTTVREVGEHIAGGIAHLANTLHRPIRVYSVPGNHGRMTHKPHSKGRAAGSLDLLATDFAEATLRGTGIKNVTFYRTASPDAYFSTYGWNWLATHGDAAGGKGGGTGFIGPMASITKAHRKLVDTSWRSGRAVHFVLTAHYHTTGKTAFGWANGSCCGYGEYARDLRADPEQARQTLLVVHPRHGVVSEMQVYLGVPEEGSHYAGPAALVRGG